MEAYTGRGLYSNHRPKNNAPEKYSPPKFEDRKPQITPKSVKELTTIHFDKPKGILNKIFVQNSVEQRKLLFSKLF